MFMRIDKLQAELPEPAKPDPNAAAALQELLGGKYGEMSTLGNYMFQSFNFRNKTKLKPFYSLVSSIFAEELGHVATQRRKSTCPTLPLPRCRMSG
jgi:Mn-containing catalase